MGQLETSTDWGKDMTLRRKESVTSGDIDLNDTWNYQTEWEIFNKDDASGLGCDGVDSCIPVIIPTAPSDLCLEQDVLLPSDVQGSGAVTPLDPATEYYVRGVVSGMASSLVKGFFIQNEVADGEASTSDGLFVYSPSRHPDMQTGDVVCLKGLVSEYFDATQVNLASFDNLLIERQVTSPEPVQLTMLPGETLAAALERHEHMYVEISRDLDLRVTKTWSFDYDGFKNNIILGHKGPNYQPTHLFPVRSSEIDVQSERNATNQLYLETDMKVTDSIPPYFPSMNAETDYILVDDRVSSLRGHVVYTYNAYRLLLEDEFTATVGAFEHVADREATPPAVADSNVRVGSFNVLNLFTSHDSILGPGPYNPQCESSTDCNRGAKNMPDFELQRDKI
ncbi:MAG: uncharacterized protein KVP18_004563, partial [Porospora cf. gigantea A]